MKNFKWLPFAALLFVLAACQPSLTSFAPEGGKFTVRVPAAPTEKVQTAPTPWGPMAIHLFVHEDKGVRYILSYNDFPPIPGLAENTRELLDSTRDGAVGGFKGKLLSESSITLAGKYTGREIQVESADGARVMRSRMYMVNNRLYQVAIALPKAELAAKSTLAYLDSFKLVE